MEGPQDTTAVLAGQSPKKEGTQDKEDSSRQQGGTEKFGSKTSRPVTETDVRSYLFRELAIRRWVEDIVNEDLEEKPGGPGENGLAVALRDGVRLCKLMSYLVPRSVPMIFEKETEGGTLRKYMMKKNIGFFIEALGEAGLPSHLIFTVSDLYDQENFLKVLECLEALGRKADEEWKVEISLKTKEALLRCFKNDIKFTPAQEERAKKTLEKGMPKRRSNSKTTTPTTTPRNSLASAAEDLSSGGDGKKKGIANTKIRKKVKKGDGPENRDDEPSDQAAPTDEPDDDMRVKILRALYERQKKNGFGPLDKSVATHFKDKAEVRVFLRGLTRLQACCRAMHARHLLRVKQRNVAYRENVAREIHKTEADYISSLNVLIENILRPLKEKMEEKDKEGMVNLKALFSDVQIIRGYQSNLMEELEPRIKNWTPNQCLGDVFVQISQFLKVYTSYVSRYNSAVQELANYKKLYPKIAEFVAELQKDPVMNNQEINSFMIRPIQRIPRYLLLLKDLVKHTEKTHNDYEDLEKAFRQIEEVASYVEAESEKAERVWKLFEIQSRLYGDFPSLATPSRRFVKEGRIVLWHAETKKNQQRVIFLFNDLLVEAKAVKKAGMDILEYRNSHHLNRLIPELIQTSDPAMNFGIALATSNVTLVKLFASSEKEQTEWFEALTAVTREIEKKRLEHEALVLERAKKRAQEAQAGLLERYKGINESQAGLKISGEGSSDSQEKVDTLGSGIMSRWESRLRELKERREMAEATVAPMPISSTASEDRQSRWEKRLQAHQEFLKAQTEGGAPDTSPQKSPPMTRSGDKTAASPVVGSKRAKRARQRAKTDSKDKDKEKDKDKTAATTDAHSSSPDNSREYRAKRLSLLRRKTASNLPSSSTCPNLSARIQEAKADQVKQQQPNMYSTISVRTLKPKSDDEDSEVGSKDDMEVKKERRRSLGMLTRGSSLFAKRTADPEERRNAFRTASQIWAVMKKKPEDGGEGGSQPEASARGTVGGGEDARANVPNTENGKEEKKGKKGRKNGKRNRGKRAGSVEGRGSNISKDNEEKTDDPEGRKKKKKQSNGGTSNSASQPSSPETSPRKRKEDDVIRKKRNKNEIKKNKKRNKKKATKEAS